MNRELVSIAFLCGVTAHCVTCLSARSGNRPNSNMWCRASNSIGRALTWSRGESLLPLARCTCRLGVVSLRVRISRKESHHW